MKTIVFGGSGFLGSFVVNVLIARNYKVVVYDLNESSTPNKNAKYIADNLLKIGEM